MFKATLTVLPKRCTNWGFSSVSQQRFPKVALPTFPTHVRNISQMFPKLDLRFLIAARFVYIWDIYIYIHMHVYTHVSGIPDLWRPLMQERRFVTETFPKKHVKQNVYTHTWEMSGQLLDNFGESSGQP